MPRNSSGTYSLPSGNPVSAGALIEASWANGTLSDLASAMTDSLSRSGEGGMTAAFRAFAGTSSAPGISFAAETGSGWYRYGSADIRFALGGTDKLKVTASGLDVTGAVSASSGFSGNLTGNVTGDVSGNAGTVTNGVYTSGSYSNPAWITALAATKVLPSYTGNASKVLALNSGATDVEWVSAASGTVTAVSVSTANGFAGTSSGGATPALTLTTSVSGLLKGNGTAMSAATAGTDYTAPGTASTWTATQTFSGSSSTFGASLLDSNETVNVVAAAPSSTTNFYIQSGSVQFYTSNAANNWTLNIAFSSGTSLNTALATNQSVTFTLVTTQGSTAYYNSAVTIDGSSVTPVWIGGAPTAGNASGKDVYRYAVIKTGSATYTVLASLTQFK